MLTVKAAMIGDVVGNHGIETLEAKLPELIKEHQIDFVTVNGENAAEGFGMTKNDFKRIVAAGADVITSGNHIWEKREFWNVLDTEKQILRPANYPASTAINPDVSGKGSACINKNGINWIVINLQGRELMNAIDCPFKCFDQLIITHTGKAASINPLSTEFGNPIPRALPIVLVDFHAESSREKEALAYYADGRATVIAGTHTHIQTADERILPNGSAYITDLGMTGNVDSVIGMEPKICIERARKQVLYHMEVAVSDKPGKMQGIIAEIDIESGKVVSIKRI
ncbi:TIGR00282 family metallophosphoesterase [Treponema sp. R80B11-R83G3]